MPGSSPSRTLKDINERNRVIGPKQKQINRDGGGRGSDRGAREIERNVGQQVVVVGLKFFINVLNKNCYNFFPIRIL